MDVKEQVRRLEQLRRLRGEVNLLSQRIAKLELEIQGDAGQFSGLPGRPRQRKSAEALTEKLGRLSERLEARRARCLELLGALYAYIDDIDDSLLRQIMTYRYIDGETWKRIAERIDERDEQYPRRLHNRYLAQNRAPDIRDYFGGEMGNRDFIPPPARTY